MNHNSIEENYYLVREGFEKNLFNLQRDISVRIITLEWSGVDNQIDELQT